MASKRKRKLEKKASNSKHKDYYMFFTASDDINFDDHIHIDAVVYNCYDPEYAYLSLSDNRGSSRDVFEEIDEIKKNIKHGV